FSRSAARSRSRWAAAQTLSAALTPVGSAAIRRTGYLVGRSDGTLIAPSNPMCRRPIHAGPARYATRRHHMAPRVITVSGPIPPERIGFTLPHEHTGISLWQIPDRWDYWELTPDEPLLIDELGDFRRRGGTTLVDLTLDGV